MTQKEKAKELVFKMYDVIYNKISFDYSKSLIAAKKLASISVNEVLKELPDKTTFDHGKIGWWAEVKKEIINI